MHNCLTSIDNLADICNTSLKYFDNNYKLENFKSSDSLSKINSWNDKKKKEIISSKLLIISYFFIQGLSNNNSCISEGFQNKFICLVQWLKNRMKFSHS